MTIKNLKSIEFLQHSEHHILRNILAKLQQLTQLTTLIRSQLDDNLATECVVANFREGRVIIEVTGATWATLLRFKLPDLLQFLRKKPEFAGVIAIECRINPASRKTMQAPLTVQRSISKKTAQFLSDLARRMENSKLKESLQKLAGEG